MPSDAEVIALRQRATGSGLILMDALRQMTAEERARVMPMTPSRARRELARLGLAVDG